MRDLLLDLGSTFIKYAVYDRGTDAVLSEGRVPFPAPSLDDGVRFVVPAASVAEAVLCCAEEGRKSGCSRMLISTQMHGYLIGGDDLPDTYVSWRDRRGDPTDPRLQSIDFISCGTTLKGNLSVAGLLSFENLPENPTYHTLGSYVARVLTGRNATHKTDACAGGFWNAETLKRGHGILPELQLPEVLHLVEPIGRWQGIEVFAPMGDHQISYLGSGAADGAYLLNIGTATQLTALENSGNTDPSFEHRPYFLSGTRLATVSGMVGGTLLYKGEGEDTLMQQLSDALKKLPRRSRLLLGGGGAEAVQRNLGDRIRALGIEPELVSDNIGQRGLIAMSKALAPKVGTMLSEVAFGGFPIIVKNSGLEFLIIDGEHGAFEFGTVAQLLLNCRLIELPCIMRLPGNGRELITKYSDMGCSGYLLPMTGTAADIAKVIEYAKYSPVGKRGVSTARAHTLYNPPKLQQYMESANRRMKIYAQIETLEGVENIEEICALPALEGVFIGPNDLSVDIGCIGDNETLYPYMEKVAKAAHAAGKTWGIITTVKPLLDKAQELGVDLISYGSEIHMLKDACKDIRGRF